MPDLSRVLDAAATLTVVLTPDGELAHWEGPWRPDGATWFDAIPEREHFTAREALSRAAGADQPVQVELSVQAGGELRPIAWTLAGAEGAVVATGVDAEERARLERELGELVDRDPLTGLLNRRRFEAELERHVAGGRRYGWVGVLVV